MSSKIRPYCHIKYVHCRVRSVAPFAVEVSSNCNKNKVLINIIERKDLTDHFCMYIIILTIMSNHNHPKIDDVKKAALRSHGARHPHPDSVRDENFQTHEFFDPCDLVQVRYEMLRRHRVEGKPVTEIASTFGTSRQAFYKSSSAFEAQGVPGLLPKKRGPKRAHKCTDEILDFVEQWQATVDAQQSVSEAVRSRFGITINPRSIERALARRKKKRQKKGEKP